MASGIAADGTSSTAGYAVFGIILPISMTTTKYTTIPDIYLLDHQAVSWGHEITGFQISCTKNVNQQLKYIAIGY